VIRLLATLDADGATHMAWDEALLASGTGAACRLYRWRPPTVSLGYFQEAAPIIAALPAGMPVVRRITGGGAIWHEHEVTYCLVGELGRDGLPARVRDCYPLLHGAVLAALARRGAALARQQAGVGDRSYRDEPRCFASPAADDLVHAAGGKVLGSAGRVRGTRVLVHGSLKLASNPWDGDAVAGCGLGWDDAAACLREALAAALGSSPIAAEATPAEAQAMERIRGERYGDRRWVLERVGPRA
jgi:lipoate-protein ligase A